MAKFVKGDVVVIPFPFSDLSQSKRRPALVLATLEGDDAILCQITSKNISDNYAVAIDDADFRSGSLKQSSNIRPNRLFTADTHIILYRADSGRPIENIWRRHDRCIHFLFTQGYRFCTKPAQRTGRV